MLALKPITQEMLGRVVDRLTFDLSLRQDLMQEALVHLWQMEKQRPGQTTSWYLQSCSFHLRHFLNAGRSVDSLKRSSLRMALPESDDESAEGQQWIAKGPSVQTLVQARELVSMLTPRLTHRERTVLDYLAAGMGAREIARQLRVSHPTAIKLRRRIAAHALSLGFDCSAFTSRVGRTRKPVRSTKSVHLARSQKRTKCAKSRANGRTQSRSFRRVA